VRLTIDAVDAFLAEHAQFSTDIIRDQVILALNDSAKTKYSFEVEKQKPDQLALLLIGNVTFKKLCSGNYHTYRGVLSVIGKDMAEVWRAVADRELELGYSTKEEIVEQTMTLNKEIKSMG
jgi:hypothetical protein